LAWAFAEAMLLTTENEAIYASSMKSVRVGRIHATRLVAGNREASAVL
jgi:hypothetical protein